MALRLLFSATDALHLQWEAIYRIQAETSCIHSCESSCSCRLKGRRILSTPLADTGVDENGCAADGRTVKNFLEHYFAWQELCCEGNGQQWSRCIHREAGCYRYNTMESRVCSFFAPFASLQRQYKLPLLGSTITSVISFD